MFINADLANLRALVAGNPNIHAHEKFGDIGVNKLSFLMDRLRLFYQNYPIENVSCSLTFIIKVDDTISNPILSTTQLKGKRQLLSLDDVHVHLNSLSGKSVIFQILGDGTYELCYAESHPVFVKDELLNNHIIYCFSNQKEIFYIGDYVDEVIPISPLFPSTFCTPTYHTLNDALNTYYLKMARESTCKILQNIWYGNATGPRLLLNNKPEYIMRNSLTQALSMTLKDADVRAEQNTDESKPVDIKISWLHSKATALIEIKWLGSSVKVSPKDPSKPYTTYSDSRAHDGAHQLINYIDNEYTSSPDRIPQAYLVIFDARRNNLKGPDDTIAKEDAFHFENEDIVYDEKFDSLDYFNKPLRFYLRPRYSSL